MEIFDLYDVNRNLVKEKIYRGDPVPKGTYQMVVHLAIFNTQGQMLIQKRHKDKYRWPNMWDVSLGGVPVSGETSNDGIQRETKEELGIDIDFSNIRPSITYAYENGFDDFYVLTKDYQLDDFILQEEEVQEISWATKEEIHSLIDQGKFIHYNKDFISLLFYLKDNTSVIKF